MDRKSFVNENALILAFDFFDKNRSGYISRDKIMSYLINTNNNMNEELFTKIFDEIDKNKDGKIDFIDFKEMMMSSLNYN